jgi:integrase
LGIADSPKRIRAKAGQVEAFAAAPATEDEKRARKDSANRILTILKAVLTHAIDRRLAYVADPPWQKVKPFGGTTSARERFLQPEEAARLVNACPPVFRDLVRGALLTGARYGELARLRCRDYNPNSKGEIATLFVAESKSGKPRHIVLTPEGAALFDALAAQRQGPNSLMFTHSIADRQTQAREAGTNQFGKAAKAVTGAWGEGHARRLMQVACKTAGLEYISFHELRHTYASMLVNNKCPLPVVAQQLGHSDSRMVEKHYGHLAPSYVADMVKAAMPTLGIVEPAKVKKLKIKGA